jgi:hypothetical protein
MPDCQACGKPLPPDKTNRPRKWCSDRCRKTQYAMPCVDCGTATNGSWGRGPRAPQRCHACAGFVAARVANREQRDEHYRKVERLWKAGMTTMEIAGEMDTTKPTISCWLHRMRRDGWDVPYRWKVSA